MKTYPKKATQESSPRDFSHLTRGENFLRMTATLLVGGILSFIFFKILFF